MHLLVSQGGGESGIVDSVPITEVEILVDGLVELALCKLLSILGQLFVIKIFGKILRETDGILLG